MLLTLKDGPYAGRVIIIPVGRVGMWNTFIVPVDDLHKIMQGNYEENEVIKTAIYTTEGYFVCMNN